MALEKVLIVGTGARKHSLVERFLSEGDAQVWAYPNNPAFDHSRVQKVPHRVSDAQTLVAWAASETITLAIVLDERMLFDGLADAFSGREISCFGPKRAPALIERSKIFAKNLMQRTGVRTPDWRVYSSPQSALASHASMHYPLVIKADGPTKGKGVFVVQTPHEASRAIRWLDSNGLSSAPLIVEEFVEGQEFSMTMFVDSRDVVEMLPLVHDYKRSHDGDLGAMTSGMGAFAPVPGVSEESIAEVADSMQRVIHELRAEGLTYSGSLTTNVILGGEGPSLLEFNCHGGDPETQTTLPLIESSALSLYSATARGELKLFPAQVVSDQCAVSITLVREGYPERRRTPVRIPLGLESRERLYFYDTTAADQGLLPTGGRVLSSVGVGETFDAASARAFDTAEWATQHVDGLRYRQDIGSELDVLRAV